MSTGKKAAGTDGFPTEIFKLLEAVSSPELFRILNDVFKSKTVKSGWIWIKILSPWT